MKLYQSGRRALMRAMYSAFSRIHLYTDAGVENEFEGHGYEPIILDPSRFDLDSGLYDPPLKFIFQAGDTEYVGGYYLTGPDGETIVSEELESPFEVTHMGTELEITLIYPFQTFGEPFIAVKQ